MLQKIERGDVYRLPTGEIAQVSTVGEILVTFRILSDSFKLKTILLEELSDEMFLGKSVEEAFALAQTSSQPRRKNPYTPERWRAELLRIRRMVEDAYEEYLLGSVEISDSEKKKIRRNLIIQYAKESDWFHSVEGLRQGVEETECCYTIEPTDIEDFLSFRSQFRWKSVLEATFIVCVVYEITPKIALNPVYD